MTPTSCNTWVLVTLEVREGCWNTVSECATKGAL